MNERNVEDLEEVEVPEWVKFVNKVLNKKCVRKEKKSNKNERDSCK
jgi:hypothetical protein